MKYLPLLFSLVIGLIIGYFIGSYSAKEQVKESVVQTSQKREREPVRYDRNRDGDTKSQTYSNQKEVPDYAITVLNYIEKHNKAPEAYVGGRVFQNREKRLPMYYQGKKIEYREWDVHPKVKGRNRGPERLVTGNESSAYYTADHYRTFIKIK